MNRNLDAHALDVLFREARSHNRWLAKPVPELVLRELYDTMKWGPTSANGFPIRIALVRSADEKERLASIASEGNRAKIRSAPVTAIFAYDLHFFEKMHVLFPHSASMGALFAGNAELAEVTAFRNGTLQGAYFMLAARALGLDCGPMSGFDNEACDRLFFPEEHVKSNFICSLGYGDQEGIFPRLPRPEFEEVCRLL